LTITSIQVLDVPATFPPITIPLNWVPGTYSTTYIWQLLSLGAVPHIRAEAHYAQEIIYGPKGRVVGFDTVLVDWTVSPFTNFNVDNSTITVQESGHYQVHSSVPWDPNYFAFDQAGIGFSVNGRDIGRKQAKFMRGLEYVPGFPQTSEMSFTYYFAKGDVVKLWAQHNAPVGQWLLWHEVPPYVFTAWIEMTFLGP
jgi:hypothetical protein